jgi:hypothetical protein
VIVSNIPFRECIVMHYTAEIVAVVEVHQEADKIGISLK